MPRVLVFASIFRHLDNIADGLAVLEARGWTLSYFKYPFWGDSELAKLLDWSRERQIVHWLEGQTLPEYSTNFVEADFRNALASAFESERPDLIILTNNFFFPNSRIYGFCKDISPNTPVVACQHGLSQGWQFHRSLKTCDFFFCFGTTHVRPATAIARLKVVPIGLSKLDRLRGIAPNLDGPILVFCDPARVGEKSYQNTIEGLARAINRPVYMRGHPMYGEQLGAAVVPEDLELGRRLARASISDVLGTIGLAIGAHSTALLEAMQVGVPTVVLPTRQYRNAFPAYRGTAATLSAQVVAQAAANWRPAVADEFLDRAVGGRRFDHAVRFADAIGEL